MTADERIRVLVAEDDPLVGEAIAALLRGEGGIELVGVVGDAQSAIDATRAERPDVVLLDVRMPGGGPRAARGIRRRSPRTQVLALSGHDDRATVLEMLEAGAVGYLVKGCSIDAILDSIRHAAHGQGSLSVEVVGEVVGELVDELSTRRRTETRTKRLQRRIQRALDPEGTLSMVFQPIVALNGESTLGVEALARFRPPPTRGPDRWFAEAADVGLRHELELAAVGAALGCLPRLPAPQLLTVNVSPTTLCTPDFHAIAEGAPCGRVVVEVTEHAPIEDYRQMRDTVRRLRRSGVRLAVDDAGAGFASLRHILRLEPDFIKLDRTLIDMIDRRRSQQALATGLISFAESIGATIIAEGVERRPELDMLVSLGVTYGQGYLLGRPEPLSARRGVPPAHPGTSETAHALTG